ncbi:MAG: sigma-54-dependent Fis family transcriptional regulator [Deltaproteobacteria bacterium]|nr:sigma-54-dependent Fis family transcriptional regulator [Deltaproteobacteria bacterium]
MGDYALLVVEQSQETHKVFSGKVPENGFRIHWTERGGEALGWLDQKRFDLLLADVNLPDLSGMQFLTQVRQKAPETPVILMTSEGSIPQAIEAIKNGALDYVIKPLSPELLSSLVQKTLVGRSPGEGPAAGLPANKKTTRPIVTSNRRMQDLLELCRKVAASKATVLIQGESGTGKELFARYLHETGSRSREPFVAVNCASLPEGLLESELFGHEKGAFTGAINRKPGKFELAHRGTILLDEISEMNALLQAKLLRVLQENEVDRIGGRQPIPIDVRVIATTNRDLAQCLEKGDFREDLFYRLNVIPLKIPPLRERPEDLELLVRHFLERFSRDYGREVPRLSKEAWEWVQAQEWRGNVREMENLMERTVLIAAGPIITRKDFCPEDSAKPEPEGTADLGAPFSLREVEKGLIYKVLNETQGNRTHAAKMLGISVRTLRNKLQEYKQGLAVPEE